MPKRLQSAGSKTSEQRCNLHLVPLGSKMQVSKQQNYSSVSMTRFTYTADESTLQTRQVVKETYRSRQGWQVRYAPGRQKLIRMGMLTGGVISENVMHMAAVTEPWRGVRVPNHTHAYWSVYPISHTYSELNGTTVSFPSNRKFRSACSWMARVRGSCLPALYNSRGMSCLLR